MNVRISSTTASLLPSWLDVRTALYTLAPLLLVLHLARVRLARYEHIKSLQSDFGDRYALTDEEAAKGGKRRMNESGYRGIRDAQEIFRNTGHFDMPFISLKALEFALFRTYGIPTISKILLRTGQFVDIDKSSKRYVDTSVLIASFFTYPLPVFDLEDNEDHSKARKREEGFYNDNRKDPRSAIAIARINWLHARANKMHEPHGAGISNDDLLYTLSTFMIVPVRWYRLYAWRPATPLESEAIFTVFYHAGRCMGIKDIPKTRTEMEAWSEAYEAKHMVYAEQNEKVAKETVDLLLFHAPHFMRPALSHVVTSLMDERLRLSMGFVKPPQWLYGMSYGLLRIMALVNRYILMPRNTPKSVVPHNGQGLMDGVDAADPQDIFSVCPASGIRAGEENGKMCPVGGAQKQKAMMQKRPKPRLTPNWWENDVHYSRAAPKYSVVWFYERLFVPEELRRGAKKWRPMHLAKDLPSGPVDGLDCGYRLEECGPRGLEMQGRKEIYDEAKRLNGGRDLDGMWGFAREE